MSYWNNAEHETGNILRVCQAEQLHGNPTVHCHHSESEVTWMWDVSALQRCPSSINIILLLKWFSPFSLLQEIMNVTWLTDCTT